MTSGSMAHRRRTGFDVVLNQIRGRFGESLAQSLAQSTLIRGGSCGERVILA